MKMFVLKWETKKFVRVQNKNRFERKHKNS